MNRTALLFTSIILSAWTIGCASSKVEEDAATNETTADAGLDVENNETQLTVSEDNAIAPKTAENTPEDLSATAPEPWTLSATTPETPETHTNLNPTAAKKIYKVQAGDTLMKIAFEVYGDVYAWRKIQKQLADGRGLASVQNLTPGTEIQLDSPESVFARKQNGNPYQILTGDTLGKISNKIYGVPAHWQRLWKNNDDLIKNPNLIFAGFTIYTPDLNSLTN